MITSDVDRYHIRSSPAFISFEDFEFAKTTCENVPSNDCSESLSVTGSY